MLLIYNLYTVHSPHGHKGQVIRATFSFNVWRNVVALQVERVVARTCITTVLNLPRNKFQ